VKLSDLGQLVGDRLGREHAVVRGLRPMYSGLLRRAYGERGVPWHVDGEPLRIHPDVRHLMPHESERAVAGYLRDEIRPGSVVFDVGAFLGAYAILSARASGDAGRVIAFEPSPFTFAVLRHHMRMNGLRPPRVETRRHAVGSRSEKRPFQLFDDEPYRNMLLPRDAGGADLVDVVTLDHVASELGRPPDWIRMDVQGAEFEVLSGARAVLAERRPTVRILAEMHPQQWPEFGIDPREAAERLAALGLRAHALEPGKNPFAQSSHAILEPLT
jgi:FkbM family methyltransferase